MLKSAAEPFASARPLNSDPAAVNTAGLRPVSKSLRWRLQLWHAGVLMAVLTIFGAIVYHLLWQSRLHQIDAELDRTNEVMMSQLGRLVPWPSGFFRGTGRRQGGRPGAGGREPAVPPNPASPAATLPTDNPTDAGDANVIPLKDDRPNDDKPNDDKPNDDKPNDDKPNDDKPNDGKPNDEKPNDERPNTDRPGTEEQASPQPAARVERRREERPFPPFPPGEPPRFPERSLADLKLPEAFRQLFEGDEDTRLYFVIWGLNGIVLQKSDASHDVPYPALRAGEDGLPVRAIQLREGKREVMHGFKYGLNVLVGRPIKADLAEQHASGVLLALAGLGVLGFGLLGGWWLSTRAIQPIAVMTATAASISADNLSKRIDVREIDDELGQLASVLNRTFDRLETAFEQQRRFTADASHELRTPLAVILAQAELALSRPRKSEDYQEALAACQRSAQRMRSLLDRLLTLARFDSGQGITHARDFDLEQIAGDCVELVRPLADERKISITAHTLPTVLVGDRERIAQVLTNLLTNAIRYNHDGGAVELRLEQQQGEAVILLSDTGVGIPPDDLPHIFDRFFRADEARSDGGSGLGLSICKAIVAAHGGTISARSQTGRGTTIEVRLPCAISNLPATAAASGGVNA